MKPILIISVSALVLIGLVQIMGTDMAKTTTQQNPDVSFFEVPLVCGAAPHIGCGSRSKPVLLDLEKDNNILEAWLNRKGTVIAVVWKDNVDESKKQKVTDAIFKKHSLAVNMLGKSEHDNQIDAFVAGEGWYQGNAVDELSIEEAYVIAEGIMENLKEETTITAEIESKMKKEIADVFIGCFTDTDKFNKVFNEYSQAECRSMENEIKAIAKKYLGDEDLLNIELYGSSSSRDIDTETIVSSENANSVVVKITGMTCTGCSNHVHSVLSGLDGYVSDNVKYPGNIAEILYDKEILTEEDIIKTIESIGYSAEIISN